MRLYACAADMKEALNILRNGFTDRDDPWLGELPCGITLTDWPDAIGHWPVLMVDFGATESDLERFELLEPYRPWREWLAPAAYLNRVGVVHLLSDGEWFPI